MLENFPDPLGSRRFVLAVDGGDSKTDVAVVDRDGNLVGATRIESSSHVGLGHDGSPLQTLENAIQVACRNGGLDPSLKPVAGIGVFCLAGADLPIDDRRIAGEVGGLGWAAKTIIRNDTFAMLRAGTDRGWGVAVVCGTGLNCAGIGPSGETVRFPSFGELSGDRAHGGGWLGRSALGAAIRARDGRGPRTTLERLVPEHFKMSRPTLVMEAMYTGRIDYGRVRELPPLVFAAARAGDAVARALIDEMADEIVANALAAIRRLHLVSREADVVLGGGIFRSKDPGLLRRVHAGILRAAPRASIRSLESPPVLGAALIGLDQVRAGREAGLRLRKLLTHERLRKLVDAAPERDTRARRR